MAPSIAGKRKRPGGLHHRELARVCGSGNAGPRAALQWRVGMEGQARAAHVLGVAGTLDRLAPAAQVGLKSEFRVQWKTQSLSSFAAQNSRGSLQSMFSLFLLIGCSRKA